MRERNTGIRAVAIMVLGLVLTMLLPVAAPAFADHPEPEGQATFSTRDVGFDPHYDAQVPLDLSFNNENGERVQLKDYFGSKPVILTLNYYDCENLCPLVLQGLADTMVDVPFALGSQYEIITVSIDPANTPEDAQATKEDVLRRYRRQDAVNAEQGWHFLLGDESAVKALAASVGFRYAYNATQDDYAHPSGIILLTPQGRISRYLYGMDFLPNDLRLALVEASQNKISTPIDAVLLLCYHYDPVTGKYNNVVMGALRAGGVVTILALGAFLTTMWRRDLKRNRHDTGSGG